MRPYSASTKRPRFKLWTVSIQCCRCRPGGAERHGFDYYRHGTLSLYAALDVKTGLVHGMTAARHTSQDFIVFLEGLVARTPRGVFTSVADLCNKLRNISEPIPNPPNHSDGLTPIPLAEFALTKSLGQLTR
jgi:hypothetical protein